MTSSESAGSRWEVSRVLRYVQQVELAYEVKIQWWISLNEVPGGGAVVRLHATASGTVCDLLPEGAQPRAIEVMDNEPYALGEAIFYSVSYLEKWFAKLREPIGARPAL